MLGGLAPVGPPRLFVSAVAMLLLFIAVPSAVGAEFGVQHEGEGTSPDKKGFTWSFRCEGLGGLFEVDADTVREEGSIPAEFRLRGEAGGTATLFVAGFDCDPAVVDGARAPFLYSLATVDLDPFDGAPGPPRHPGSYDFLKFTDSPRVHSRFSLLGVSIHHLQHMSVQISERAEGSVRRSGQIEVPWTQSPFTLSAEGVPGVPVPDNLASDHWSNGEHGVVYGADNNCEGRADPAMVTLETAPGTVMARILGENTATAPGVFLHLSASGHVAFEGETQRPAECPVWN